ncbi:aminoglycoside phosphotransferase family protein [Streptomyces monticola]|uniref:Aminoglycoside phosphotransferase family protein n=1 Tax=Streptomyces monticola TaxID=2666263 RepID=A0ABW2JFW5_9ACTN
MRDRGIEVQPLVRRRAQRIGRAGERWLAELPTLVRDVAELWSLTLGPALSGGSAGYVVAARTLDGRRAVLKVALPDPDAEAQIHTLRSAGGHGYVRLLAYDIARLAMLQEELGPPLSRLGLTPERQIGILSATLRRAWQIPRSQDDGRGIRDARGVRDVKDKATSLAELVRDLWQELDHPCSTAAYDQAMTYAERRAAAHAPERCVLVHGDPHPDNALRAPAARAGAESGFVFVDPDGFPADPAYDLGVVLRDWCPELLAGDAPRLARRYCSLLADETATDPRTVWEWGYLERVSTGLYLLAHGAHDRARPFLATAELLAER